MTASNQAQKVQVGWGGLIALVALGWRWSYLIQSGRDPLVDVLPMSTDQASEAGSMLFTACLATWMRIADGSLLGLRDVQVVVGVINSLLVWRLATVLLGHRTGVVAGLFCPGLLLSGTACSWKAIVLESKVSNANLERKQS